MIHEAIYCKTLVELATDYLDGGLDDETRADVEVHIATCAGCVAYMDQMRLTIELIGRIDDYDEEPAAPNIDVLLQEFRNHRARADDDG